MAVDENGNYPGLVYGDGTGMPVATKTKPGGVKQAEAVADVAAAPTKDEFNGLLAKLRAAGILAAS